MEDQYSNYIIKEINATYTLNGSHSLDENIADNGGIRAEYLAYGKFVTFEHSR